MNNTEENFKKDLNLEKVEEIEFQKYRKFEGSFLKTLLSTNLALIPIVGILYILGIHQKLGLSIYTEQYIGIFLGLVLCAVYLSVPATKRASKTKIPWYDWILAALGLNAGLYILFFIQPLSWEWVQ